MATSSFLKSFRVDKKSSNKFITAVEKSKKSNHNINQSVTFVSKYSELAGLVEQIKKK